MVRRQSKDEEHEFKMLTSVVYDGGIKMIQPGMTHLGAPMQKKNLGHTSLPMDIVMEYLESIKEIYTAEV